MLQAATLRLNDYMTDGEVDETGFADAKLVTFFVADVEDAEPGLPTVPGRSSQWVESMKVTPIASVAALGVRSV